MFYFTFCWMCINNFWSGSRQKFQMHVNRDTQQVLYVFIVGSLVFKVSNCYLGSEHTYASNQSPVAVGSKRTLREAFTLAVSNPAPDSSDSEDDEPAETFTPTQVSL